VEDRRGFVAAGSYVEFEHRGTEIRHSVAAVREAVAFYGRVPDALLAELPETMGLANQP
jgi:hypothetical protein